MKQTYPIRTNQNTAVTFTVFTDQIGLRGLREALHHVVQVDGVLAACLVFSVLPPSEVTFIISEAVDLGQEAEQLPQSYAPELCRRYGAGSPECLFLVVPVLPRPLPNGVIGVRFGIGDLAGIA